MPCQVFAYIDIMYNGQKQKPKVCQVRKDGSTKGPVGKWTAISPVT